MRAPDAAFVSRERFQATGETESFWPGAPELAVEVISPTDSPREVREKTLQWLAHGTVAVLVIEAHRRAAAVHRAGGETRLYRDRETIDLSCGVPGFTLSLAELFG